MTRHGQAPTTLYRVTFHLLNKLVGTLSNKRLGKRVKVNPRTAKTALQTMSLGVQEAADRSVRRSVERESKQLSDVCGSVDLSRKWDSGSSYAERDVTEMSEVCIL